jgi:hypothetical protein
MVKTNGILYSISTLFEPAESTITKKIPTAIFQFLQTYLDFLP